MQHRFQAYFSLDKGGILMLKAEQTGLIYRAALSNSLQKKIAEETPRSYYLYLPIQTML